MLNKVDVDALQGAREAITQDPAGGIAEYGIEIEWQQGVRGEVKSLPMRLGGEEIERDFTWIVDEPPQLLGDSQGPTPQEYLMSGVGACIMVGFAVNASVREIELRSLKVTITGSLDLAGFLNLRDHALVKMAGIQYHIDVDADADPATLKAIEEAAVNFSPNAMTVAHGIPISGSLSKA